MIPNVPTDITSRTEMIELVKKQNPELLELTNESNSLRLVAVHDTKFDSIKEVIIEVSPQIRKFIMKTHKIKLGLCLYPAYDHIHVLRCSNCNRYGHPERYCKAETQVCGICAEDHASTDCTTGKC